MYKRIVEVRKKYNLTQGEFAERLGLTRNFISLVENGNRDPSDRTISDICREFNVNETWLRTGDGEMFNPVSRDQEIAKMAEKILSLDDISQSILFKYLSLSDSERDIINAFLTLPSTLPE